MDILTDAMTVYICDDNREHMNTLHQKLESFSRRIAIEEFVSSSDLLMNLEELQNQGKDMPKLILLDIKMPEENGIQIGKKIRELAPELLPHIPALHIPHMQSRIQDRAPAQVP